jgi:hypothetical protein
MTNRRDFIKKVSAAGMFYSVPNILLQQKKNPNDKIWACLLHLSFNFASGIANYGGIRKEFEPIETVWNAALDAMVEQGMNMVLINLDDSVNWKSHPEIALRNAWSTVRLREEIMKMRKMGLEPIPMLNFSSTHDAWLGEYSRMLSTDKYYSVCSDLITEAIDIFDKPRFFHLGMDEEAPAYQINRHDYLVVRQNDLWWGDFYFLIGEVMKGGVRPWVWSDYYWNHPEQFVKKMPRSVVQSNWYYGKSFDEKIKNVKAYVDLEGYGYDQIPTGKYYDDGAEDSIINTVKFCNEKIADPRLLGFLTTFWKPVTEEYRERILKGIENSGTTKKWFDKNHKLTDK